MRLLDLKSAAVEIRQALDQSKRRSLPSPFFFMVGAGISHPPLPLAAKIQNDCKEEALKYGKTKPPPSDAPIESYSYWFEQAYPHPENRQQFLRELMQKAFISRANFRLAHLLIEKTVTDLVVTTNFDDFLSRALTLFGHSHIVCDHPRTLERIDLRSPDVQIIHLHGSYWFYDCCNLRGEIADRAEGSSVTSFTMLSMLDDILRTRSPLVVGYNGWEGDVFMTALKRRLESPLRTNLYWFCYRRRDAERFPEWLISRANVCIVVPDEAKASERAEVGVASLGGSMIASETPVRVLELDAYSGAGSDPTLAATAVFDELIRTFKLDVPPLTKDPLGFFSNHLKMSLLGDKSDDLESDVYAIRGVVDRLEHLRRLEEKLPPRPQVEAWLESFRNAVRQSNDREAVHLAHRLPLEGLTVAQLREVSSVLANAGLALDDNSNEELLSYNLTVAIADRLDALGQSDISTKQQAVSALLNKAVKLVDLNRDEKAIAVYDEVVQRFGDATEPAVTERVAVALGNKGLRLTALNRNEEALAVYDEVVRRFGGSAEPALCQRVASALVNRGNRLGALNRSQEAITAYDEVVRRFGDATEPALAERVARALVNKGWTLGAMNDSEDAVAVYDDVVRRFGDATHPGLREQVANALIFKAIILGTLNRVEEAVASYDEVVRRFSDAPELALGEHVAKALVNKGAMLGTLKRSEESIAVYDEVVHRFGDATEPALRELVAMGLMNKARRLGALNRSEEAIAVYDDVVWRFGDATEPALREQVAKATARKEGLIAQ